MFFFFIPTKIETLEQWFPWANWLLVCVISGVSLYAIFVVGNFDSPELEPLILDGYSWTGLFGCVLLHVDLFHLIGNMIFLVVFGNALCSNINNGLYLLLFLACALIASVTHVMFDGHPAVGASGAINGVVGATLAMYPKNRVYLAWVYWMFMVFRSGLFSLPAAVIFCAWFAYDILGSLIGYGMTAYFAHIGGFLGGLVIGLIALALNVFKLTPYDNASLLDVFRGIEPER